MSARRISIRKIIQTIVTLVVVSGCAVAFISADRMASRRKVKSVDLTVKSPSGVRFLTREAVERMLFEGRHLDPMNQPVGKLNEHSMEAILLSNPWVKQASVYTDAERVMHISVTQRVPVVRLFEEDGSSYYIDEELKTMPLSTRYTHFTAIVTGVPKLRPDSAGQAMKGKIAGLVKRITKDTFWNAMISQVNMRPDGGFDLIPILGKQKIILGDTAGTDKKLANLLAFYQQVQNKVGWDMYNTIDLRFEGQVVAAPPLPWKAPTDRALSNMNWLSAVMENVPQNAAMLGGDAAANADSSMMVAPPPPPAPAAPKQQHDKAPSVVHPKPAAAHPLKPPKQPQKATSIPPKKPSRSTNSAVIHNTQNTTRHNQTNASHAATKR